MFFFELAHRGTDLLTHPPVDAGSWNFDAHFWNSDAQK